MPQETNLNVAPYFDDFDPDSNYYKVLFKPGYPVQARELTTLQSILQNQIEDVGNHLFKEGAAVIPGGTNYEQYFYGIQIQAEYLGVPVSLYLDQIVGKTITGATSGVTAKVVTYITNQDSEKGNYTLYLNYQNSSSTDAATATFLNGEVLLTNSAITYATTFISAGEGFAVATPQQAAVVGSAFTLSAGVFFLRGYLVDVPNQLLLLSQYSSNSSVRVGLNVLEEIVTSETDPSLNDNAKGFNNYTAPGADRLRITATLFSKPLDDFDDQNFIQLAEIQNGSLRKVTENTEYNFIGDEFARRTFDESGHYYVKELVTTVRENLNNGEGNRGIYNPGQTTYDGNVPSDDLMVYKVSPGKAYVRGYEVDIRSSTLVDVPKPRTTKTLENQAINFGFGPTFEVDNVYGSATIGFNTSNTISLRDERVGSDQEARAGKEIGVARIYDFVLESGAYDSANPTTNRWDLSLWDVQTYTDFTVNEAVTLSVPVHVTGESSGASAFLKYGVSAGTAFTAYNVQGNFFNGERLLFNGVADDSRYVTGIRNWENSDIKSVFGIVGSASTFSADLVQKNFYEYGTATITGASGGVSTVTVAGAVFPGIVTTGNIVSYQRSSLTDVSYARVTTVNTSNLVIEAVESVSGVNNGALPTSQETGAQFRVLETKIQSNAGSGNRSSNQSIYSIFPRNNIESVDLTDSSLVIRKQFTTSIDNNSTPVINAEPNEVFLPFDEERYILMRSNGTTEVLTSDKVSLTNGSTSIQFNGLSSGSDSGTILIATLRKSNVTSKVKTKVVSTNVLINKSALSASGIGGTTLNDGLTYGDFPFGTRVQDSSICLNVPDAYKIHGIYESKDTSDPEAPYFTTASLDGPNANTTDLIIGETITGTISGAKAIYLVRKNDVTINFAYLNNVVFEPGEVVNFSQSGISAIATNVVTPSKNITNSFDFRTGQKETFYDYSRIVRKKDAIAPVRKLKVYFAKAQYDSSDTGDITTVNSYDQFNYSSDIPKIDDVRVTDLIDARPRVKEYTVASGSRSPFEFDGRDFDGGSTGQHSSKYVLASDESVLLSFDYYLPRSDKVCIDKEGFISVVQGAPADDAQLPEGISGSMAIANIFLPPYLYNTENARVDFIEHKRYQMSDIARLENRISNLEYYSSLSQLETATVNSFVPDANGLNRFKSGVFVDNFSDVLPQDLEIGIKNSIDRKNQILRPSHYTTALSLQLGTTAISGIGTSTDPNEDERFAAIQGTGIKRTGQIVTLDYTEVEFVKNPYATRVESVTPFLVQFWDGKITLEPDTDVWVETNRIEAQDTLIEGDFNATAKEHGAEVITDEDGNRIGVGPTIWESWETTASRVVSSSTSARPGYDHGYVTNATVVEKKEKTGTQVIVNERIDTTSLGDRIVSREVIHIMRSRNIEFTGKSFKPFTEVYCFFDNVDVSKFCTNKLIEIEMISGTFETTETVVGTMPSANQTEELTGASVAALTFRLAQANHKYGAYNSPGDVYDSNPYNRDSGIPPSTYSETSTFLNIDTFSLQSEDNPEFFGYAATGMILVGQSSGAQARVSNVRLLTDKQGTLIGSFRVPDTANETNPSFETGRSTFRLTSSPTNNQIPGTITTSGEQTFYSQGEMDTVQEQTLSVRNADVEYQEFTETRRVVTQTTSYHDPLAQTFMVDEDTGIFVTKVDVFFQAKDESIPVWCQIRETTLGTPNHRILPFSEIFLDPENIQLSDDGTVPTSWVFESPVYLEPNTEYAFIMGSSSTDYTVWISQLGEVEVTTLGQEAGQIIVSSQPLLGSLFKSQNATVWTPSQYEDLKFTMYRAEFATAPGNFNFYNPKLPESLQSIPKNGISMDSRNLSIGIGTIVQDTGLVVGNTIIQNTTGATGTLTGFAGSMTGDLTITNAGVGYTPSSGYYVFSGVAVTSVTGNGINGTAEIAISNGVAIAATVSTLGGGKGYAVGDVLTPIEIGNNNLGEGMRLSVGTIYGNNELIIDDVQGNFATGASDKLFYQNSLGITTELNYSVGGAVVPQSPIRINTTGTHMRIFQRNHGLYSTVNRVTLKDITTDVPVTSLAAEYTNTSTGAISIGATTNYTDFENVAVGATNPGYVKIGKEIISYTGFDGATLTGITRGIDNTVVTTHSADDLVYKYELNGVSLRRINTSHNLADVTVSDAINLDSYYVNIQMDENGTDRSGGGAFGALYFNDTENNNGSLAKGTYNIPYNIIIPRITTMTPTGTTVTTNARTVSGSSVDGNQPSWVDQGYTELALSQENYLDSPRVVASQINENTYLAPSGLFPGNKSFSIRMNLQTLDNRISPVVDLDNSSVVFVHNRTNAPITNYATDFRVNTFSDDPNRFVYVTKAIKLENPATSLQVLLDAYIFKDCDVRVFFSLNQDTTLDETVFVPFPGYNNLDAAGNIISTTNSDGLPDKLIDKSDVPLHSPDISFYKEYSFTANNLNPYDVFRIKIIGSSTTSSVVPQIRNLRAISFA
jgi:hypothetical protein